MAFSKDSRLLALLNNNNDEDSKLFNKYTETENGATTLKSSGTAVLDFFSKAAAIRDKNAGKEGKSFNSSTESRLKNLFDAAVKENLPLAVSCLFYLRDIRGGQGEREAFKLLINHLAKKHREKVIRLIPFFPEYGRWDDLFALQGTAPYLAALDFIKVQLINDAEALRTAQDGEPVAISLCAKWMPSEGSGKESKKLAYGLANSLRLSMAEYRKFISVLRQHLQIVETKMCEKRWSDIDYSKLPSRASFMYRRAFTKRDETRYKAYIEAVKSGKAKINAGTLYPYEIVDKILTLSANRRDETLEQLWYALPNYINENHRNSIAVVDVSGSMSGTPMSVAISIGMYLAERNTNSIWKDHFITFETTPHLVKIIGKNITEKVKNVQKAPWGGSTDLQAVFDLILDTAKKHKLSQEELPETIYIVSDMEFNQATRGNRSYSYILGKVDTNLNESTAKYKKAGYERPKVVFWNLASRNDHSPASYDDRGVALFSGLSTSVFKTVLSGDFNPLAVMLEVLLSERYLPIVKLLESLNG